MSGPLGIDMLGGVTCVGIDPCHQRDAPRRPGICPAMEIPPMDKDGFAVAFNFRACFLIAKSEKVSLEIAPKKSTVRHPNAFSTSIQVILTSAFQQRTDT